MVNDSNVLNKYVGVGVIKSELRELFGKRFQENCFADLELFMNQSPIKVVIKVKEPHIVIGDNKFYLKQLQNMVAQRLGYPTNSVDIIFEKIMEPRLEPAVHAETLRKSFVSSGGMKFKHQIQNIIKDVKKAGGQGVMVKVSGKLKGLRARSTKFFSGLLIQSGQPAKDYIKTSMAVAKCKQGVIGVTVSIMMPYDAEGIKGPSALLPDKIVVLEPKHFN